ncbi:hypothetical protein GGS26DRAFT_586096 [Hypomontagnella submonticulosa]|nr:hypothetical protein GGS26DRAFT_586096 [Hypomontagnella submonticulosa]
MVDVDIDAFLRQGYWPNSRARSPDSRVFTSDIPSNQSSYVDGVTRSNLPCNIGRPRHYPPPPSVEDETESLAKEYRAVIPAASEEEPVHRGDPEQYPILLPVHEYNPERRFVLVSTPSDSTDDSSDNARKLPSRSKSRTPRTEPEIPYEANTGRKYDAPSRHEEESEKKRDTESNRERRRSKLEYLPTIVTDVGHEPRSPDSSRPKSTTRSEKGGDDYFSPRLSSRLQAGNTLSPDVIEHASRGRDRAYYQGGSNTHSDNRNRSAHSNVQYEKSPREERRYKDKPLQSAAPISPTHHKRRSTADISQQVRASSKVNYEKTHRDTAPPSPRRDRNTYARSERDTASQVSLSPSEKRESGYFYSSDDEVPHKIHPRDRRQSTLSGDTKPYLPPPTESRSGDKRRSRGPSPLPSPRTSRVYEQESTSSSSRSATFPKEIRFSRNEQRSHPPPLSRASTGRSELNSSAPMLIPAVAAVAATAATAATPATVAGSGFPTDANRSNVPPPLKVHHVQTGPRSSTSALSTSPQRHSRRPTDSGSLKEIASVAQPVPPYKRYLDDFQAGGLPDMQRCPRREAVAGYVDWLTLPRCDNFNICPTCYETTFSNTEFAHHFVPVPFRPTDRPLACDFGTSRYYNIAYYLINKYRKADLTLFRNISNVAAKSQPCTGARESTRIWYSVKDPRSGQTIQRFNVCYTCAKTVEVLLPNLTGVFVPMDSPAEPTRGVCAMHQQNERRFLFYFDLLEATSDKALITNSIADVQALADRLRDLTSVPECAHDKPVRNREWYIMRSIPDFCVCEECFGEVVWPMIQEDNSSIAANFHQYPQKLPLAACQLYSERMRSIFMWAVRHTDIRYLDNKVKERRMKEQEYHASIVGLDRQILGSEWVDAEVDRSRREWRRWE